MRKSQEPVVDDIKRPGRPKDEAIDERIIAATLKLIDTDQPITVKAVVQASGVSRSALYRRWNSINDLISSILGIGHYDIALASETGHKEAIIEYLLGPSFQGNDGAFTIQRFRKRVEMVMADPELQQSFWNSNVRRRREAIAKVLRDAQDKGLICVDLNLDACIDAMIGVFYYQTVVRGEFFSNPETEQRCRAAIDVMWQGMEPTKE